MKLKSPLILLLAGLAAPLAHAEVTIGGSIEADILFHDSNAAGYRGEVELDVEPRLYFTGTDKLDNGSEVIWKIWTGAENYRSDADKGNSVNSMGSVRTWGNREAWGGWRGDWGQLQFGKSFSPIYNRLDGTYALDGSGQYIDDPGLIYYNPTNSITYYSPSLAGFTIAGQYSFRDQNNQNEGQSQSYTYELLLGYEAQTFRIDAGYEESRPETSGLGGSQVANADGKKDKFAFGAGRVKFGDFDLAAGYRWWKHDAQGEGVVTVVDGGTEQSNAFLQALYTFGKNRLGFTYSYFWDAKDVNGNKIDDSASNAFAARWTYALSKSTSGYADFHYTMNDKHGAVGADGPGNPSYTNDADTYRVLFGTYTDF
ncbi:porin [Jeongeupia chitinilytica]|uniref:Porin domain-containing protein n=1 Tax=Jeongeupia chitinilytica TaxID=1041641 RepID=A0ABQ3H1A8_9NEIS|nr:porin [Jeongeupia chitinilytica]GHD62470.1 hypothetical protein GCM10007350_18480 [Jeongeupia chitinilytica]